MVIELDMNLSEYKEIKPHRFKRIVWAIVNAVLFRFLIGRFLWSCRRLLLLGFGAVIDRDAYIYESAKIFAPWNLVVGRACVGPYVNIYNKAVITIGNDSVVSQDSTLCTASHDVTSFMLPLVIKPITIGNHVWIASEAFVGMGVTIGDGAVVGARAAVFKDVESMSIVGGNPASVIKSRLIKS